MTSGNVTNIGPNLMVNSQMSAKEGDNSTGFLDVMNKNVTKIDKKVDTQNQVSSNKVTDDKKATVDETKAEVSDDKEITANNEKADKVDNHFSDAKKATDEVETEPDEMVEAVAVDESIAVDEIPDEVISLINEVMSGFADEVAKVLEEALNITEDELNDAMATLNLSFADLLNPKELTSLMVEVSNVEDSVSLVLNEKLSDALSTVRDLSAQVLDKTGVEVTVIKEVTAENYIFADKLADVAKQPELQITNEAAPVIQDENYNNQLVGQTSKPEGVELTNVESDVAPAENEVAQVIVNKDSDASKTQEPKVSTGNGNTDTDEVSGDVFVRKEANPQSSDNSGNMNRGEQENRPFVANIAPDAQNVQSDVAAPQEARPVINRFETMQLISQISEQARVNISREVTSLEMILNPESLGKIYLNVTQEKGAMKAQIVAQNEIIKEALEQQVIALKDSLNKAGVKVEAVEVSVGTHEFERNLEEGMHQQEEQGRRNEEQNSQRRRTSIDLNNMDELQGLMSEEDRLVAQMMRDQGNSVNYMA